MSASSGPPAKRSTTSAEVPVKIEKGSGGQQTALPFCIAKAAASVDAASQSAHSAASVAQPKPLTTVPISQASTGIGPSDSGPVSGAKSEPTSPDKSTGDARVSVAQSVHLTNRRSTITDPMINRFQELHNPFPRRRRRMASAAPHRQRSHQQTSTITSGVPNALSGPRMHGRT